MLSSFNLPVRRQERFCPHVPVDIIDGKPVLAFQPLRNPALLKVLTFTVDSCPVSVEILSSHTLWDLVYIIFQECDPRGENEAGDDHCWTLTVPGSSKLYESGDVACLSEHRANRTQLHEHADNLLKGAQLHLEYDYGTTTNHVLTVCGIRDMDAAENFNDFPRRQPAEESPAACPSSFQTNAIDLDAHCPSLNQWAFEWGHSKSTQINLFQAGRRRIHGYLQRRTNRMICLPDKVCSLEHYLQCLEQAASVQACGWYNWQSVIALPQGSNRLNKYNTELEPGFCDCVVIPAPTVSSSSSSALKDIFPKVAALGGFRRDEKIKKGWIRYTNQVLMVVVGSGSPTEVPNAPKGTAWEGKGCHVPGNDKEVLFRVQKKIGSVHELFCEVEGLLNTL